MNESSALYRATREVLLDALEALQPHLHAVVLVGAQAVYVRTEGLDLPVAPFTTDGDIVLDPRALGEEPDLSDVMRGAGFELAKDPRGHAQPGVWTTETVVEGRRFDVPIDLIVPTGFSATKRRSARLPGHTKGAARTIPGLEAALLDHDTFLIEAIERGDDRRFHVPVAGTVALLIAKAYKLHERLEHGARPDRVHEKDAGDVLRLMQAADVDESAAVANRLIEDDTVGDICRDGVELLVALFRTRGSPGTRLALRHFRTAVPEARVIGVATAFVTSFQDQLTPG